MAEFLDKSDEEFTTELLCFKHKMRNLVLTRGSSALSGEFRSLSEVFVFSIMLLLLLLHLITRKQAIKRGHSVINTKPILLT